MNNENDFISPSETLKHFDYTDAEKQEILSRIIHIESIGHAFDPLAGFIYPVLADGKLDYDNFILAEEIHPENGISDKDYALLELHGI
jgi:hypothetical protein